MGKRRDRSASKEGGEYERERERWFLGVGDKEFDKRRLTREWRERADKNRGEESEKSLSNCHVVSSLH